MIRLVFLLLGRCAVFIAWEVERDLHRALGRWV